MGLFDSVLVACPKCGHRMEFQSKAGPCLLGCYTPEDMPAVVAVDLVGEAQTCQECGARVVGVLDQPPVVAFVLGERPPDLEAG